MMSLLEVHEVTKRFGGLLALHRISCTIEQGQITGLSGSNRAGKTTTLNTLSGLAFVAVFAPLIVPHSQLDPVRSSREQCLAR